MVNDDEICMQCHEAYVKSFHDNVHRVQNCESCHGPASKHVETRGKEPGLIFSFKKGVDPVARAEACLKCHEQNQCTPGRPVADLEARPLRRDLRRLPPRPLQRARRARPPPPTPRDASFTPGPKATLVSYNAADAAKKNLPSLRGTSHHLGAMAPDLCLKCHCDMRDLLRIAGPHQIGGPNGFNCTTCHDPHGQIRESTRKDLCLSCHKGAPTMAWHSSTHERYGVACTDCHNPHPHANVRQIVNISHYGVEQPKRLAMSVQEPEACYKCHQKIFAMNHLPSHHPIMEGKMVCSDCHDPHGQLEKNLKAETINLLCYKCHAEKTGPFAYPHPPVNENCCICHEPHGTVANNLLKQPPAFLCLRCHAGHRPGHGTATAPHRRPPTRGRVNIDANPNTRPVFYTNCTNCHTQIHGSDVPSPTTPNPAILFR